MQQPTMPMIRFGALIGLCVLSMAAAVRAVEPDLRLTAELVNLLRTHYVDRDKLDDNAVNNATTDGLLRALGAGAKLILPQETTVATNTITETVSAPIARAEVIEPDVGYVRVADVQAETVAELDARLQAFSDAKVTGYVLDLRFANGTDYAAAAALASRFVSDGQPLFAIKSAGGTLTVFRATAPASALPGLTTAPLMVLVNAATSNSAEALAAALKTQQRAILLGSRTAGSAAAWQQYQLSNGRILRLATAKVMLPATPADTEFSRSLFPDGIEPDITVAMDIALERQILLQADTNITLTASLQPRLKKKGVTEADLVRAFRGEATTASGEAESTRVQEEEIQEVRDAVLQRAVDILKGIRTLLSWQR